MDASPRAISPLRRRMIDDMRMRKLAEKTQSHYLRWVQRFAVFLGRSPDTATVEDLRRYQLHRLTRKTGVAQCRDHRVEVLLRSRRADGEDGTGAAVPAGAVESTRQRD
jgi:hypothetical protein